MQLPSLVPTETIDRSLLDLDLRANGEIISTLLEGQRRAVDAVQQAQASLDNAIAAAAERLGESDGRLVLVGAGASGRIAVQDGAELWPTFSWPHERLLCVMAGGDKALVSSVEGVEDDAQAATREVAEYAINEQDVVVCIAASGKSPWTCQWLAASLQSGALTIGMANNADTPLLKSAAYAIFLDTGPEVLAGSTRMAAGTAQKIALNLFSTTLMIRMHRTFGNLMVDMGAVNIKLDQRRIRLLQGVLPDVSDETASRCLGVADGWVKLAALVARGDSAEAGRKRLAKHKGSLRAALKSIAEE
ncbi:MAG: N-acetylmuramic acid 6-phosphate etherase [Granulosicoccus sp.]